MAGVVRRQRQRQPRAAEKALEIDPINIFDTGDEEFLADDVMLSVDPETGEDRIMLPVMELLLAEAEKKNGKLSKEEQAKLRQALAGRGG
jgi:hypothetical protein